jgi:preprotein translocase subunit SecD
MKKLIFLMAVFCLFMDGKAQSRAALKDGLYVVAAEVKDSSGLRATAKGKSLVPFNPGFLENAPDSTLALLVNTQDFVPLELAEEPQLVKPADQKGRLQLSFSRLAAQKLEAFTRANLMKPAALIVNGQVLTMHKIRAVITGGKMEISRCADNACDHIYVELKNNVKR